MRGFQYHGLLSEARYLRSAKTTAAWTLHDLGAFPGIIEGEGVVEGELYRVSPGLLVELDELEGCPDFYRREVISLEGGERASLYVLQRKALPPQARRIPGGCWRRWCFERPA